MALVRDGRTVELGPLPDAGACDAALVDDLLRFDLAARRLGWRLRLVDAQAELVELFDLIGVNVCGPRPGPAAEQ